MSQRSEFRHFDRLRVRWAEVDVGAGANMLSFGRFQNAEGIAATLP